MSTVTGVALAVLFLAADPPDDPNRRVAELIRQLGADSYLDREAATRALREIGEPARAALQRAAEHEDLEVRLRAAALFDELRQGDLWHPTRLTFSADNLPTSEVLRRIARETGNPVGSAGPLGRLRDVPIIVNFNNTPFWQAIDEVCRLSGNQLRPFYDRRDSALFVVEGSPGNQPVAYAGPVRVSIVGARRSFVEDFEFERGTSRLNQDVQFTLQIMWEERFRLVGYSYQLEGLEARTDTGEVLTGTSRYGRNWAAVPPRSRQLALSFGLSPPASDPAKLDELSFSLRLAAVGDTRTLTLEPLTDSAVASEDGYDLTVEKISQSRARWDIVLRVSSPAPPADSPRLGLYDLAFEAFDSDGHALRFDSQNNQFAGSAIRHTLRFSADAGQGPPAKLLVTYPLLRSTRELKVRFRDVPLPTGRPK